MMDITLLLKDFNLSIPLLGVSTGAKSWLGHGDIYRISSPVDGQFIADIKGASKEDYETVMKTAKVAFTIWKDLPAPRRGDIVRQFGLALREEKEDLGTLVSYEMGKSLQEGLGEVQEMIDICDFAVGLSRQLYGLQMHSERPNHRMLEQWHPLGIVGIISAFNFPVAVWAWNLAIALVCGNVCVWKPSEKTPVTAIACQNIIQKILKSEGLPEGISSLVVGAADIGELMAKDTNMPLVSATGSTRMGKSVAKNVASRLGKSILELGGNNAIIVSEHSDLKQAVPAITFGAVGTCGQRCTTTRRLIVHESIYDKFLADLSKAFEQLSIGNPLNSEHHVGPLIDTDAVDQFLDAVNKAKNEGAKLIYGGYRLEGDSYASGCYVAPTIMEVSPELEIIKHETFAPIVYVMQYKSLEEAIEIQNSVPQGLSSSIFTLNIREAGEFLSASGSDCGIANVNIGTSGAEIGGAFGGEKDTGGGRESGSDAWKSYMRRQTCTINFGNEMPLAQGIEFNL